MLVRSRWIAAAAVLWSVGLGCGGGGEVISDREVTVGCGMCQFGIVSAEQKGCYWAVELGGKHLPVYGALPHDHENHAPTGMCNMTRRAVVDGTLKPDRFVATRFELLPAVSAPDKPAFTAEDVH